MQTMEQALSDLVVRGIVTLDDALSRSSRPEQLFGLLERAGVDVSSKQSLGPAEPAPLAGGLRVAEA
jgi:Tfp pilus assembly ATPase PilU